MRGMVPKMIAPRASPVIYPKRRGTRGNRRISAIDITLGMIPGGIPECNRTTIRRGKIRERRIGTRSRLFKGMLPASTGYLPWSLIRYHGVHLFHHAFA